MIWRIRFLFTFKLGNVLATHVLSAFKKGLDIEKFHVVGHSLGAQLAGVMGRKIISKSNQSQKLKRFEIWFQFSARTHTHCGQVEKTTNYGFRASFLSIRSYAKICSAFNQHATSNYIIYILLGSIKHIKNYEKIVQFCSKFR